MKKISKSNEKDTNYGKLSSELNIIKYNSLQSNEVKKEDTQLNNIWDINHILLTIFTFSEFKDLVNFNTVCNRWNRLINPIIHRSIKLLRSQAIQSIVYSKSLSKVDKIDAEARECIIHNSKFANLVKEFKFSDNLLPKRTIEFFSAFKFITDLTIANIGLGQDLFISIIKPLVQLKQLKLEFIGIVNNIRMGLDTDAIQLPSTLTKLRLNIISMTGNLELFVKTINSHTSLEEFQYFAYDQVIFLEPFYKNYPSLKVFEFDSHKLDNDQVLLSIIENNSRLKAIKLKLSNFSDSILNHIKTHLVNLEELSLLRYSGYTGIILKSSFKFDNPTKIKKLTLKWDCLSSSSLESILVNCPNLKEIEVQLPKDWKAWIDIIHDKCFALEKVTYIPCIQFYGKERDRFNQELFNYIYLTNNLKIRSTLVDLTLSN